MMANNDSILRRLDRAAIPLPMLLRVAVGVYFIYSGFEKIGDPVIFLKNIRLYQMLPEEPAIYLNTTAIVLPWIEVVCGLALVLGFWIRGAALTLALMLAVFTPAIFLRALAIRAEEGTPFFQIAFDCGCGSGVVVTWKKLLFNTTLFLGAIASLASNSRRLTLGHWLSHRSDARSHEAPTPEPAMPDHAS